MCLWIDTAATKQVEKRCIFHMSLTSQGWTPQIMLFVLAVLHIKWRQIGCFFFFFKYALQTFDLVSNRDGHELEKLFNPNVFNMNLIQPMK